MYKPKSLSKIHTVQFIADCEAANVGTCEETLTTASANNGEMSTIQWEPFRNRWKFRGNCYVRRGLLEQPTIIPMMVYFFCCMLFSEWGVSLWLEVLPGARTHKEIIAFICLFTYVLPSLFKEDSEHMSNAEKRSGKWRTV